MTWTLECGPCVSHLTAHEHHGHSEGVGWLGPREKNKTVSVTVSTVLHVNLALASKSPLKKKRQKAKISSSLVSSAWETMGMENEPQKVLKCDISPAGPQKESKCISLGRHKQFRLLRVGVAIGPSFASSFPFLSPSRC